MVSFHLLAWPPVESFGALLSFAIPVVVGKSFKEGRLPDDDEVIEIMMEGYKFSEEEHRLLEIFAQMFDASVAKESGMESGNHTNISLFEIPAIMHDRFVSMDMATLLVRLNFIFLHN